jgi:hypothetical protein
VEFHLVSPRSIDGVQARGIGGANIEREVGDEDILANSAPGSENFVNVHKRVKK